MKTISLSILFSISITFCLGQSDTIFYDQNGTISKRNIAKSYRLPPKKDGTHYIAKDYFINNVLQMVGVYASLNPDVRDGKFLEYNEKGMKISSGNYTNNRPTGIWTYYDENGKDSTIYEWQKDGTLFYLNQGHYASIRGKKQFVIIEGKGDPTVVFVTGKGRNQHDYRYVYKTISEQTQIFAYDRAGLGQSESLNNKRSVDTMAYELNELLVKEKINPPYILVGHSLGGWVLRCFVNMYPKKVAGLIFIDGGYEREYLDGLKIRSQEEKIKWTALFKTFLNVPGRTKGHNDESACVFDFDSTKYSTNGKIVKDLKLPNNIPISVYLPSSVNPENPYDKQEIEIRLNYYENWKKDAPQLKIIRTPNSGHFIQIDEPNLIIDGITEMLTKLKTNSR